MRKKHRLLFFCLAASITALFLCAASESGAGEALHRTGLAAPWHDHLFAGLEQSSSCMSILMEAASKAGVNGAIHHDNTYTGNGCFIQYLVSSQDGYDATFTSLYINISDPTIEKSCENNPQDPYVLTTFHGYNAVTYYRKDETRMVNDVPYTNEYKDFTWCMYKGDRAYRPGVSTGTASIEVFGAAHDPIPIAEILLSIAEARLPLSEVPVPGTAQAVSPVIPGELVPGQPGVPSGQTAPTDAGGFFGIPMAVILGSLGIPVLGAAAGAILSAILSGLSSAAGSSAGVSSAAVPPVTVSPGSVPPAPVSPPEVSNVVSSPPAAQEESHPLGYVNERGEVWDKRDWDKSGKKGFVSKDVHDWAEQQRALDREWTDHGGWQTRLEQEHSRKWDDKNRKATESEDSELKAKEEAETQDLTDKRAKLDEDKPIKDVGKRDFY